MNVIFKQLSCKLIKYNIFSLIVSNNLEENLKRLTHYSRSNTSKELWRKRHIIQKTHWPSFINTYKQSFLYTHGSKPWSSACWDVSVLLGGESDVFSSFQQPEPWDLGKPARITHVMLKTVILPYFCAQSAPFLISFYTIWKEFKMY